VSKFRGFRNLVLVMSAFVLALSAAPAHAAITLANVSLTPTGPTTSVLPSLGDPYKPGPQPTTLSPTTGTLAVSGTVDLLANRIGLGTLAEIPLCPTSTTLGQLLAPIPGATSVTDTTTLLACALHFLDFEWRTTHPGPPPPGMNNRIVTTIGVPTPLYMDSDLVPDMVATVSIMGFNKFGINFQRVNGTGAMPGTAELVISNPSHDQLPVSHIGIGLDSNAGKMPSSFGLTFTLESFQAPISFTTPPKFRFDITATRQSEPVHFFADLFDENLDGSIRKSLARGSVGMVPVPASLSTRVALAADNSVETTVSATEQTKLDADVVARLVDSAGNGTLEHVTAVVDKVPTSTTVRYVPASSSKSVTYDASSAIDDINIKADHSTVTAGGPPALALHGELDVQHVPQHVDVKFTSATSELQFHGKNAAGQPDGVGSVTAHINSASPPAMPGGLAASHAVYRQVGSQFVAEAKASGIRTIEARPSPLHAVVDSDVLSALDIDAAIDADSNSNFERSLTASLRSNVTKVTVDNTNDSAGNHITVDTGTPIGSVDVTAHEGTNLLPLGIHDISLSLKDLPEITKVDFPKVGDVVDISLLRRVDGVPVKANGIGLIDLHVNGGSAPTTYTDHQATPKSFSDTDGVALNMDALGNITSAGFRLRGLRGFSFGTKPYTQVGIDVNQSQAKPFVIDAHVGTLFAKGVIDKIPANLLVKVTPKADTPIDYAADNPISEIELETNAAAPTLKDAIARVVNVPTWFKVCTTSDGFTASCMRRGNRFDGDQDKKFSFAYESGADATSTPSVHADLCFDSSNCSSGMMLNADVTVPTRLEIEVGAGASGDTSYPYSDCFDNMLPVNTGDALTDAKNAAIDITRVPGDLACTVTYAANWAAHALDSLRAHAFLWLDTGNTAIGGTAKLTIPRPADIFTAPIEIALDTGSFTADGAYLDGTLSLKSIADGAVLAGGGSFHHSGGGFGARTKVGVHTFLDLTAVASFVNALPPAAHRMDDIQPLDIDVPLGFHLGNDPF